ncbi:exodeoxyribonuclease VII small subunit [Natronosalvus amylolyticus]|uniref:exodeoxyribonuclease VII small subunit n=1 Tax=Natronosalvus amylolyticus TaxID=2961994 RepID=UPI0020C9704E|nr:exodeoxyribonuclease VII small subunit [Natronosalvus amylolyticus]
MTDTTEPGQPSIGEQTARLEEIITQLEDGEVSLERAKELHVEGKAIVEQLEADLEVGEGTITDSE